MAKPGKKALGSSERYYEIPHKTRDLCFCFGNQKVSIVGFTDANYAAPADCRKSTSGYVFTLRRGAVSWIFRLQKHVV